MPSSVRAPAQRAVVLAAAVVIAAHGLVHLMGVALPWKLAEPCQLRYADAAPAPGSTAGYLAGGLWLMAAAGAGTSGCGTPRAIPLPREQPDIAGAG